MIYYLRERERDLINSTLSNRSAFFINKCILYKHNRITLHWSEGLYYKLCMLAQRTKYHQEVMCQKTKICFTLKAILLKTRPLVSLKSTFLFYIT